MNDRSKQDLKMRSTRNDKCIVLYGALELRDVKQLPAFLSSHSSTWLSLSHAKLYFYHNTLFAKIGLNESECFCRVHCSGLDCDWVVTRLNECCGTRNVG